MNPRTAGIGLHAFIGRHLFKSRQLLGAYIYLQAHFLRLVKGLTYAIIYTGRQPMFFISRHHVEPIHTIHLLYIHAYKRMVYYNRRL